MESITKDLNTEIENFQKGLEAFLPAICKLQSVYERNVTFVRKRQRSLEPSQKEELSLEIGEFFNKSDEAKEICNKLLKPFEEVQSKLNQMAVERASKEKLELDKKAEEMKKELEAAKKQLDEQEYEEMQESSEKLKI